MHLKVLCTPAITGHVSLYKHNARSGWPAQRTAEGHYCETAAKKADLL
jgi:hypothetical protein